MKTILCFGDSNTHGASPEPPAQGSIVGRYPRNIRWPGRLQQLLGDDYHVVEEGLNGRTTVWEDPVEGDKSGKRQLPCCLLTHAPLDLVILMLGTNDFKVRFHVTPADIARSVEELVQLIAATPNEDHAPPKVLLVAPVTVHRETFLGEIFGDRHQDSLRLGPLFQEVAARYGAAFLNLAQYAQASPLDGLHLDRENHKKAAEAIHRAVCGLLSSNGNEDCSK